MRAMTDQRVITWLDPGLTTGLAWWDMDAEVFGSWQYEQADLFKRLACMTDLYGQRLWVGYEKYLITSAGPRRGTPKHSLEVIAVVRDLAHANVFELLPSMPSSARLLGNVTMLRRLGWYKPGKPHANDAAQHTLAYLLREKKLPRDLIKKALGSAP
jgi:hypothetical protein